MSNKHDYLFKKDNFFGVFTLPLLLMPLAIQAALNGDSIAGYLRKENIYLDYTTPSVGCWISKSSVLEMVAPNVLYWNSLFK